jgi:hypothetical protein
MGQNYTTVCAKGELGETFDIQQNGFRPKVSNFKICLRVSYKNLLLPPGMKDWFSSKEEKTVQELMDKTEPGARISKWSD